VTPPYEEQEGISFPGSLTPGAKKEDKKLTKKGK
jgi:hypothetical protein